MNVLCDLHVKKVFQLQLCDVFSNQGNETNTTLYEQKKYVLYVINHHFAL